MDACPECLDGNHTDCYDGDGAREELEAGFFLADFPPPFWGCDCECPEGDYYDEFR